MQPLAAMKQSITWGAIVGIALGATVTLALSRGWLEMPWSATVSRPVPATMHEDAAPGAAAVDAPYARPLRPGGLRVGDLAAAASLSRS